GEVERICDRVAIVDKGRLVAVGTVEELTRGAADGRPATRIRVSVRPDDHATAVRLLAGSEGTEEGPGRLLVAADSGREVNEILARGGVFADGIALDGMTLEETFLALTRTAETSDAGRKVSDAPPAS